MTTQAFALGNTAADTPGSYQPGVCNIGPAEIARRRRAGHVGVILTVGALGVLVAMDAPAWTRLSLIAPAAIAASGYLQARLKFCAGYGQLGVFNFGSAGDTTAVADAEAKALDRRRARQISAWSFAIGAAVGIVAVILPI